MNTRIGQADVEHYENQLDEKIKKTQKQFFHLYKNDLEVFKSPPSHFRMRAEFKIWHENDTAYYAMYQMGEYKKAIILDWEFSIGSHTIVKLMPKLLEKINSSELLKSRLFQVEFLSSQSTECLVTLIYHKKLDDIWEQKAKDLADKLNISIIGRSRNQKITLDKDYIKECFIVENEPFNYIQMESGFTQPNAAICQDMLNWACLASKNFSGDLLELYCGNGNFTLPLSRNFEKVLATEISKTSVRSAINNIDLNGIKNISVVRMSSEEFTQALNKEREFRRLGDIKLQDFAFTTLFLDPPRAGLDEGTRKLAQKFKNIIYISCNPDTLQRDLDELASSHKVTKFALFDQFPYTNHRECGVILTKR